MIKELTGYSQTGHKTHNKTIHIIIFIFFFLSNAMIELNEQKWKKKLFNFWINRFSFYSDLQLIRSVCILKLQRTM